MTLYKEKRNGVTWVLREKYWKKGLRTLVSHFVLSL